MRSKDSERKSEEKIFSLSALASISESRRKNGEKIVLCHGCFDPIHPGHLAHFKEAKKLGDILIVSLTCDKYVREQKGEGRPVYSQGVRALFIAEFECVDFVIVNGKPTVEDLIFALKPNFYVKGSEFKNKKTDFLLREEKIVKEVGGELCFLSGDIIFSSTELVEKNLFPVRGGRIN